MRLRASDLPQILDIGDDGHRAAALLRRDAIMPCKPGALNWPVLRNRQR